LDAFPPERLSPLLNLASSSTDIRKVVQLSIEDSCSRDIFAAWEPHLAPAVYVNDLGDEGEERVRSAYGENYARLIALKAKYDPTDFFYLNQNTKPIS